MGLIFNSFFWRCQLARLSSSCVKQFVITPSWRAEISQQIISSVPRVKLMTIINILAVSQVLIISLQRNKL